MIDPPSPPPTVHSHRTEEKPHVDSRGSTQQGHVDPLEDAISTGDPEIISKTIDELIEPDVLIHMPMPTQGSGAQALKEVWPMLFRGLPDLHVAFEDLIAEGDKVVMRNTVTGTHQGEYRGLPPTGKSITYNEIFIYRFANGRVAEMWGVVDVFSQMQQLGVIPAQRT